jgi:RNA-directed DNA polymerase
LWIEGRQEGKLVMEAQHESKSAVVPARDKQAEEDLWQRYKAERGVWTEPMLAALERGMKENKWFSLIDKVYSERVLALAWEKVRINAGACGVDGITIKRFGKDSKRRLLAVREQLSKGLYQPKSVKRVWIPKPGSNEKRPLGIPTVTDRVVQAAVRMVIEPIFEDGFHPHSYGFRPGRGCKDALREVWKLLTSGHTHVVEIDIRKYFDNIQHERLVKLVRERITDGRVLQLLEGFLRQGVMDGNSLAEAKEGTPQGGVISPLLANIFLNPLDWEMSKSGFKMVRYADDMVVMCQSQEEAQEALRVIGAWMEEVGLELNQDKSRVVDMNQPGNFFEFLGYRFKNSNRNKLMILVKPKSKRKLTDSIKPMTQRNNGNSMETICQQINPRLKGWYAYFKHARADELRDIDRWIRVRLRSILRKRIGLQGLGRGADHQRWSNRYFTDIGLFSLENALNAELASLRNGAKC